MKKLDAKFDGVVFKVKDGSIVPPDQYMVFLAKDNAVPQMLQAYIDIMRELKAGPKQIAAAERMLVRVYEWRGANRDMCKAPDVGDGERLCE